MENKKKTVKNNSCYGYKKTLKLDYNTTCKNDANACKYVYFIQRIDASHANTHTRTPTN